MADDTVGWELVCQSDDLAASKRLQVRLTTGRGVLLLHRGGSELPAALDAFCYHHGGPLVTGDIEDVGDGRQCIGEGLKMGGVG